MRRSLFRTMSALALLLAVLAGSLPARAILEWCPGNPVVRLDGAQVRIVAEIPQQYVELVTGPIAVSIKTPGSVRREVVMQDAGFNGHGEVVTWEERGRVRRNGEFLARIAVEVPVDEQLLPRGVRVPVRVTVTPEGGEPVVALGTHRSAKARVLVAGRADAPSAAEPRP